MIEPDFRFKMTLLNGIFQIRFQSIGYSVVRNSTFIMHQRLDEEKNMLEMQQQLYDCA